MWVYFNILQSGDSRDRKEIPSTMVPMTRPLNDQELEKLVEYYNTRGPKLLPPNLPYVDGRVYAVSAQAMKEMEKLAADEGLEYLGWFCTGFQKVRTFSPRPPT